MKLHNADGNVVHKGQELPEGSLGSDLSRLWADVDDYNDEFSPGRQMARAILSGLRIGEGDVAEGDEGEEEESRGTDEVIAQNLADLPAEQSRRAADVRETHIGFLQELGLSAQRVGWKVGGVIGLGQSVGDAKVRINVRDGEKFLAVLRSLAHEDLKADGLSRSMERIAESLTAQVADEYDWNDPEEEALELIGYLPDIIGEYQRLGLGDAVKRLAVYFMYARQGALREYLIVESKQYLLPPKGSGFGPGQWQGDSAPKKLRERWEEAIVVLAALEAKPKAVELAQSVRRNLSLCLAQALGEVEGIGYYDPETRRSLKAVLIGMKERLAKNGVVQE